MHTVLHQGQLKFLLLQGHFDMQDWRAQDQTTKLLIIKRPALLLRRHFTPYDFSSSHLNWWSMKHQFPGAVTSRRFISQSKYNNTNVLWMIMKVYLRRECYCTDWLQLIKKHLKMLVCSTAGLFSLTSSHQNTLLCHTQRLIYTHVGIVHIVDCNLSSKMSARCVVFTEKKAWKRMHTCRLGSNSVTQRTQYSFYLIVTIFFFWEDISS